MKKEDEIKIYRAENGYYVRVISGDGSHPTRVFVYIHCIPLLEDMDRFFLDEEEE